MATPNFDALVQEVRDWSNRDASALPDTIIRDAISYAADDSYHRLMIPPLESTFTYTAITADDIINNQGVSTIELAVPSDLVQFIHLRTTGNRGLVWNEKTDVRTFHDMCADKYSGTYWTRQGNNILIAGPLQAGDVFELFYYRRLPAADAVYRVSQANIDAGVVVRVTTDPNDDDATAIDTGNTFFERSQTVRDPDADGYTAPPTTGWWLPDEIPHWLKDENRKILLFGALSYCGKYLTDDMMVQYHDRQYALEIESVNSEERKRRGSGGNTQMHYTSYLI